MYSKMIAQSENCVLVIVQDFIFGMNNYSFLIYIQIRSIFFFVRTEKTRIKWSDLRVLIFIGDISCRSKWPQAYIKNIASYHYDLYEAEINIKSKLSPSLRDIPATNIFTPRPLYHTHTTH